ncbi:MAG TPA: hypothetical protein VHS09_04200 [Polyangiaceae bacterium]|nr:hypothetical protein [Polyangiaceae bacterium]
MNLRINRVDAVRGAVAGSGGASIRAAAQALFDAGGNKVLPTAVQRAVRSTVERPASKLLTGAGLLEHASAAGRLMDRGTTRAAVSHGARAAGRQVFRSVGAAAAVGALVDGGWATMQAVKGVRAGSMTEREAVAHVAREAGTGALATAAGTATAALLVAMTGGIAAPALFAVAAVTSIGAKLGLDGWLKMRAAGAIRAHLQPTPA